MAVKKKTVSAKTVGIPAWRSNKTVLVTGASGGIGYDLASIFAEHGYNLVLVARSEEKLFALANQAQQMFGVSAKVLAKDLAGSNTPEEIYRELTKSNITVDILVNNAGYGLLGPFGHSRKEEELDMIRLNISSVAHLTKLFLPGMLQRRSGKILNVASTAAFQPGPLMANYYATKAYVLHFTVALAEEVKGTGVSVSVLCPGPTFTGFQSRAGIKGTPLFSLSGIDSRLVARSGYEGLMAGQTIIVPGILNKLGTLAARVVPMPLMARVVRTFQEKRRG